MAVRNELIHCELCGEDYASAYRRCPFCDGRGDVDWDDRTDELDDAIGVRHNSVRTPRRGAGGRRAAGSDARGGGYGGRSVARAVAFILSLALIVAAAWIILFVVVPKLLPPSVVTPPAGTITDTTPPVNTISPNPITPPPEVPPSEESPPIEETTPPVETQAESPAPPSSTAVKLNRSEFTLSNRYPTFQMTATGGTGKITWSISGALATVSQNGLVTAVSPTKAGEYCVVTATDEAGATATCIVRVDSAFRSDAAASPEPSSGASAARLSHTDVTLNRTYGTTFTISVKGGDFAVTWSSSNAEIATVTESGVVTGVGSGTCTIRATLGDGTVLSCRVIVSI